MRAVSGLWEVMKISIEKTILQSNSLVRWEWDVDFWGSLRNSKSGTGANVIMSKKQRITPPNQRL